MSRQELRKARVGLTWLAIVMLTISPAFAGGHLLGRLRGNSCGVSGGPGILSAAKCQIENVGCGCERPWDTPSIREHFACQSGCVRPRLGTQCAACESTSPSAACSSCGGCDVASERQPIESACGTVATAIAPADDGPAASVGCVENACVENACVENACVENACAENACAENACVENAYADHEPVRSEPDTVDGTGSRDDDHATHEHEEPHSSAAVGSSQATSKSAVVSEDASSQSAAVGGAAVEGAVEHVDHTHDVPRPAAQASATDDAPETAPAAAPPTTTRPMATDVNAATTPDPPAAPADPVPAEAADDSIPADDPADDLFDDGDFDTDAPTTLPAEEDGDGLGDDFFDDLGASTQSPVRSWVDNTGLYRVEAKLVQISTDSVRLLKSNGRSCTVPLRRLSRIDFAHVQTIASKNGMAPLNRLASR